MPQCSKCRYVITLVAGERQPPWCPRCGADLKATADAKTAAPTPALVGAARAIGDFSVAPSAACAVAAPTPRETPASLPALPSLAPVPPPAPADEPSAATPEEVFGPKPLWSFLALFCVVVCVVIAAVAASQLIRPPRDKPIPMGVYGCLAMFGLFGLGAGYVAYRLFGQKYAVFPDRLVEWQSFRPNPIPWDQIREVFQDMHPAWTKYRVSLRGGRVLHIGFETNNHKRLGDLIGERVAARLLPGVMEELAAGRSVRFGRLYVTQGGVQIDGQFEPWHRIGVLTFTMNPKPVRGTSMVSNLIHVRIGSVLIELGEIPNYRLFEELARRLFPACVA